MYHGAGVGECRLSTVQEIKNTVEKAGCGSSNICREKVSAARADRRELNRILGKLVLATE